MFGHCYRVNGTVHHHVSAVLAKIGVSLRTAAREAARIGIAIPC